MLCIDAPAKAIAEIERQMGINEDILRHLTVRVDAIDEAPSAMMQKRDEREGRGDREGRFGDRENFRPRRRDGEAGEAASEGAM